jgi:2-alkenal reductase
MVIMGRNLIQTQALNKKLGLFLGGLCLLLGACNPTPAPMNAALSTPVESLPVSADAHDGMAALPTAVPPMVIEAADAEYVLLANIYDRTIPSVVNIEADMGGNSATVNQDTSRGSGFIFDMQGHIITSAHVVKDARDIRVTFNDGFVASGQLVGVDTYSDLGVVKVGVELSRLQPLRLGDSDHVRVGQRAIAIGNPFGLSGSMSVGIVSGLGRTLRSAALIDAAALPGFQNPSIIQTDTPINPGNSGGPLLNSQADVIGVSTAIRTESGVFQGVGFAVPTNTVKRVVPELIAKGRVDYAWLGISVTPEDNGFGVAGLAEALKLPVSGGVLVRGVTVGSPADKAGLRGGTNILEIRGQPVCAGGDIIVAVNGQYVRSMDELVAYLVVNAQPDDTITLRVVRERQTFEVPLLLEARPASEGTTRDCAG